MNAETRRPVTVRRHTMHCRRSLLPSINFGGLGTFPWHTTECTRAASVRGPRYGLHIWPSGLRDRYGVAGPTLWRWERAGKLPTRDVFVAGRAVGW